MKISPEEQFEDRLRLVMEENHVTQVEISRVAGVSQSTVSRWLTGDMHPTRLRARRIAIHYNLSDTWLLHGTGERALTLDERLARERAKARQVDEAQAFVRSIESKGRSVVIIDSPLKPPRELRFDYATEEEWIILAKFLEERSDERNRNRLSYQPQVPSRAAD